jgi:hypothetical protein
MTDGQELDEALRKILEIIHGQGRGQIARARIIAGLSGFFTLIQSRDGPDR